MFFAIFWMFIQRMGWEELRFSRSGRIFSSHSMARIFWGFSMGFSPSFLSSSPFSRRQVSIWKRVPFLNLCSLMMV